MRVDRDAAAIVGDGEVAVLVELDLDEGRVARHRLVHGIVDHLGEEVVQRLLVGAADIHAGPAAHRLQPLQHLDRGGVVAGLRQRSEERLRRPGGALRRRRRSRGLAGARLAGAEQVAFAHRALARG